MTQLQQMKNQLEDLQLQQEVVRQKSQDKISKIEAKSNAMIDVLIEKQIEAETKINDHLETLPHTIKNVVTGKNVQVIGYTNAKFVLGALNSDGFDNFVLVPAE